MAPKATAKISMRNKKSLEQVQLCIGVPSYSISHENRYSSFVLNTLLGGGMSSRLFQNVREKTRAGVLHFQRTESLSRYGLPGGVRGLHPRNPRPRLCSLC